MQLRSISEIIVAWVSFTSPKSTAMVSGSVYEDVANVSKVEVSVFSSIITFLQSLFYDSFDLTDSFMITYFHINLFTIMNTPVT